MMELEPAQKAITMSKSTAGEKVPELYGRAESITGLGTANLLCTSLLSAFLFFTLSTTATAQKPQPKTIKLLTTPIEAVNIATLDAKQNPQLAQYFRYVWIPDGDLKRVKYLSYALNLALSRSSVIVEPVTLANGKLVRIDLRRFTPDKADRVDIILVWEKMLETEPYFHIGIQFKETKLKKSQEFKEETYTTKEWVQEQGYKVQREVTKTRKVPVTTSVPQDYISFKRVSAPYCEPPYALDGHSVLEGLTLSQVPIVRYDWFLDKLLSTVDGGLYYDFAGVITESDGDTSAQVRTFARFGIDEDAVQRLQSDQRAGVLTSKVTGKPRRIDVFRGLGGRAGTGLVMVTHDVADADLTAEGDPFLNLLEFKDAGREIIFEKNNGLHVFVIADGEGNIVDEVPPNIAADHTIPAPYTKRIQGAISCIRCHGIDGSDGIKNFQNDVPILLKSKVDVFDDLSDPDTELFKKIERLAGLYEGDMKRGSMSKRITRGKDDYSDAIFLATGGMTSQEAALGLADSFSGYYYTKITPDIALAELGFSVPEKTSVETIQLLLAARDIDRESGIKPEDGRLALLKAGIHLNRNQWELAYADAFWRVTLLAKKLANTAE